MLGPTTSPVIDELSGIACTVAAAAADDQNYTSAIGGGAFDGRPEDDFSAPASRERIFAGHVRALEGAATTLEGLDPADALEEQLVEAARDDVEAALALVTSDRRYAPGDPKAPLPEAFPTRLDEAVEQSSQEVKDAFGTCTLPADVLRRQKAYGGG